MRLKSTLSAAGGLAAGAMALSALLPAGTAVAATNPADINPACIESVESTTGSLVLWDPCAHTLTVIDAKQDGDSAYDWYNAGTGHVEAHRSNAYGGSGTQAVVHLAKPKDGYVSFQACRNVPRSPDNCSHWATVRW